MRHLRSLARVPLGLFENADGYQTARYAAPCMRQETVTDKCQILCRKEIFYSKMSQKERDQLTAEFSILSSLNHENIVKYYHREHLKSSQQLMLYMEYCGGGDLSIVIRDLKRKREFAREDFVWNILSQLVCALFRCHYGNAPPEPGCEYQRPSDTKLKSKREQAIMHRDLKPDNVFLCEDQNVKLGDFGLSKIMSSHDFASTYVGTPYYMSPEISSEERYTLHSDIWALGCVIYELVTHRPPFDATSHLGLIQKIRKGDFAPIPSMYSKELSDVISSCLRVNPARRPDTATLLTNPRLDIARRMQETVNIGKTLKLREAEAAQKIRQAEERLSAMEADQASMKIEIEGQLRREWEVKARLEIDRQVQIELETLRNKFEREVDEKVQSALAKHSRHAARESQHKQGKKETTSFDSSSYNTAGEEDFPSTTDLTDLSELSLESPASSTTKPLPKKTKTPFARSKTTLDSPADIQMSEPSPISISGLALSPRRNAAAQATANSTTTSSGAKNIFAEAARQKAKWQPTLAYNIENEENIAPEDSDSDDDFPDLPSPTRIKPSVASTDPFKQPFPSKVRPGLVRQNTIATTQRLTAKPTLFPTTNHAAAKAEAVKASIPAAAVQNNPTIPRSATEENLRANAIRPTSPNRRLSKIPSRNDIHVDPPFIANTGSTSPLRRAATNATSGLKSKLASAQQGPNSTVGGRTLVELAQARAGGRPMSADVGGWNVGRKVMDINAKELPPVPVWDPMEEGDNMPSPFLKRDVRTLPARGLR